MSVSQDRTDIAIARYLIVISSSLSASVVKTIQDFDAEFKQGRVAKNKTTIFHHHRRRCCHQLSTLRREAKTRCRSHISFSVSVLWRPLDQSKIFRHRPSSFLRYPHHRHHHKTPTTLDSDKRRQRRGRSDVSFQRILDNLPVRSDVFGERAVVRELDRINMLVYTETVRFRLAGAIIQWPLLVIVSARNA